MIPLVLCSVITLWSTATSLDHLLSMWKHITSIWFWTLTVCSDVPVLVMEEERNNYSFCLLSAILAFTGLYVVFLSLSLSFCGSHCISHYSQWSHAILWLFLLPFLSTFSDFLVSFLELRQHVNHSWFVGIFFVAAKYLCFLNPISSKS